MLISIPDGLFLLLVLLPGYVLTYVLIWQARVPDTFSEGEKQAFSLTGSMLLAAAGYLLYILSVAVVRREIVLLPDLQFTPQGYFAVLSVLTLIAIPVGYVIGTLYNIKFHQRRGIFRTRRRTWDYINQEAKSPVVAAVKTPSGKEIQGDVQYAGEQDQDDLLLRKPLLKSADGEVVRKLGRYTYIPASEIDRVDIFTGLKDRRRIDAENQESVSAASSGVTELGTELRRPSIGGTVLEVQLRNETNDDIYTEVFAEFIGENRCILDEGIAVIPLLKPGERRSIRVRYNGSPDREIIDTEVRLSPVPISD